MNQENNMYREYSTQFDHSDKGYDSTNASITNNDSGQASSIIATPLNTMGFSNGKESTCVNNTNPATVQSEECTGKAIIEQHIMYKSLKVDCAPTVEKDVVDEVNERSVFVGNVDYGSTPVELQEHFKLCGIINRITIIIDKNTGHPKGYAYIEFQSEDSIKNALALDKSTFRQRELKVIPKRKNLPGYTFTKFNQKIGRRIPFSERQNYNYLDVKMPHRLYSKSTRFPYKYFSRTPSRTTPY